MLALGGLVALLIGATVGLLGGGGATLTLPLLLYGFGLEPHAAIAGSLAVVCATSVVGATVHARRGHVDLQTALLFGGVSTLTAYAGGRFAEHVSPGALVTLFAIAMVASAWRMLVTTPCATPVAAQRSLLVAVAAAVGAFAGLVGAGGGFLVVPALVLVGRVPMHRAIATSLAVIAMQSAGGLAGHLSHATFDLRLLGIVAGLSAAGAALGALVSPRLAPASLRRGFAVLLLAVAALFLHQQLPVAIGWTAVAAIGIAGGALWWRTRPVLTAMA